MRRLQVTAIKQFQSPDYLLSELMQKVGDGRIQLPDFQREWVWDNDHIEPPRL